MKITSLKISIVLLVFAAIFVNVMQSQQRRITKPDPTPIISDKNIALSCDSQLAHLFASVPSLLTAGAESSDLRSRATPVAHLSEPDNLLVTRLQNRGLAYLVGYTCHPTSTELKSAFQIFKANGNHYSAVARSQDFSTLSEKDADGSRVDDASLDVHPLPTQPNQQTYFETTFIQGGGTPAEFSVVVWSWDGDTLHEIFKKAFLRAGGVQIVGSTFAITDNHNDGSSTAEVYQLNDGRVLFSGLLNKTILAQAEASGRLIARNSEELNTLGSLWESLGEENRAIAAYNQSIQQDQSENNRFIYLALSELYEKTGQNVAAANTLERYKNLPGNALTPEMRLELEQKVQQLTKP